MEPTAAQVALLRLLLTSQGRHNLSCLSRSASESATLYRTYCHGTYRLTVHHAGSSNWSKLRDTAGSWQLTQTARRPLGPYKNSARVIKLFANSLQAKPCVRTGTARSDTQSKSSCCNNWPQASVAAYLAVPHQMVSRLVGQLHTLSS